MRILHTSDWHLGKRLYKLDRTEEHELFLNWLIETLVKEKIDVLVIAGDVFDSPTPPHQSLELFYHFLYRVSVETKAQTLLIAGNHDSGLLLEAPSKILSTHRVKVWGKLLEDPDKHWIQIENIHFCAIPFFRSYELLPQGEGDALSSLKTYFNKTTDGPKFLILHHLAGIVEAAGSEQVIHLSGVDSIPADLLKDFSYVALGHIHKPQKIASQSYYSGSPLPLRFSETAKKSVVIIDESEGRLVPQIYPIPVFRDFFNVKTNEENLKTDLENLSSTTSLTPMVEIQINLKSPRVGLIDEIKSILAEKRMELLSYIPLYDMGDRKEEHLTQKLFELSPLELFEEFYKTKYPDGDELPEDLKQDFKELLEKVKHAPHST